MTDGGKMKFTKTEAEYNMKSIRFLLLTITTMFIIISGLMIVLGLSVYTQYHSFYYFLEATGFVFTPSILSVLLGMVLMVVTMFGFFGTLRQSTCMVNSYACILLLLLFLKLVVVILAFTMNTRSLLGFLNINLMNYANDPEINAEFDELQYSLKCCGSNSYRDYAYMQFNSSHSVLQYFDVVNGEHFTTVIPASCCARSVDTECTIVYNRGCKEALADFVSQNAGIIGVLGVSVMFIEILGITFALLLGRCIRKVKSERAFLEWKLKEQQIWDRHQERHRAEVKAQDSVYIAQTDSSVA